MIIIYDSFYQKHDSGPAHPENAGRLPAIISELEKCEFAEKLKFMKPYSAAAEQIQLIHSSEYVGEIKKLSSSGGYHYLDMDTVVSKYTYECALLAAGGCFKGLDLIFGSNKKKSKVYSKNSSELRSEDILKFFALVRPPGHHAFKSMGSGFCIFNNISLAARYAKTCYDIKKIMIIDFDAHHGNGTQDFFYNDGDVFYISFHQYPHYPGTGYYNEIGSGNGKGFNLNFPFAAGTGDADYAAAFIEIIIPLAERFQPELILVSAGYDSHLDDPLSSLGLVDDSYFKIMILISFISRLFCKNRLGIILEGGYNYSATARSVAKTISGCIIDSKLGRASNIFKLKEELELNNIYEPGLEKRNTDVFNNIKKIFQI